MRIKFWRGLSDKSPNVEGNYVKIKIKLCM